MATKAEIEQVAERYRQSLDTLLNETEKLDQKIRRIKSQHAATLRRASNQAANDGAELERLIEENPDLFHRPKSFTVHGIKVGYQQTKAALSIQDEAATVTKIKEVLPGYTGDLIEVKEKPRKNRLWSLGKSMLERIGVAIVPEQEEVIVKPVERDALKMARDYLDSAEAVAKQDGDDGRQANKGAA